MCGIFAALSVAAPPLPPDRVDAALATLAPRGPDGEGRWRSDDGSVVLAHRRLAIVDREGGHQPVATEDEALIAVVNGEIYDAAALARWLRSRGHRVRTRCDSELLLHLYAELGDAMVERLHGELAFVLVDRRRRRVVAGRDRFGVKPLFLAAHGGRWLLASRASALLAAGVPARPCSEAVTTALALHYPPADKTLFEGIEPLGPGTLWSWEGGRVRRRRWAAVEEARPFATCLSQAVTARLVADTPVAVQLSGGVDSASVLALASREGPRDAFTVSFPGRPEDERDQAEAIAAHVGARLRVVEATPSRLADAWPAAVRAGEGLAVNAHLPAKWLLAKTVREEGFSVVLTGEGADEVLLGYPHLRVDAGIPVASGTNQASAGLMLPDGETTLMAVRSRLGFVPTFLQAKAGIGAVLAPCLREPIDVDLAAHRLLDSLPPLEGPPVERSAALWQGLALEGYILRTLGDGMEMAHGLEGRLPFLDARVAAALAAMPWDAKICDGVEKAPLREAMTPWLPAAVCAREKHPFVAPVLEGPLIDAAGDALSGRWFDGQPWIDPVRARRLLDRAAVAEPPLRKRLDPALWLMASLAHWGEAFFG